MCGINLKKYLKRQPSSRPLIVMRIGAVSILMLPRSQTCPRYNTLAIASYVRNCSYWGFSAKYLLDTSAVQMFLTKCLAYEFKHNDFD